MKLLNHSVRDLCFFIMVSAFAYVNAAWGSPGILNTILLCWALVVYFSIFSGHKSYYSSTFFVSLFGIWAVKAVGDVLNQSIGLNGSWMAQDEVIRFGIAPFAAFMIATTMTYKRKLKENASTVNS